MQGEMLSVEYKFPLGTSNRVFMRFDRLPSPSEVDRLISILFFVLKEREKDEREPVEPLPGPPSLRLT